MLSLAFPVIYILLQVSYGLTSASVLHFRPCLIEIHNKRVMACFSNEKKQKHRMVSYYHYVLDNSEGGMHGIIRASPETLAKR